MPAVELTTSSIIGGSEYADDLQSQGTYGVNLGDSTAEESLADIEIKRIYIRHNGIDDITNLRFYLKEFSQSYGGVYSPQLDLAKFISQGNKAGKSYGIQYDTDWDGSDFTSYNNFSNALGGISPETAKIVPTSAIFRKVVGTSNGQAPTNPVAGKLGPYENQSYTYGDCACIKIRSVVPPDEALPGRRQVDLALVYNYTT